MEGITPSTLVSGGWLSTGMTPTKIVGWLAQAAAQLTAVTTSLFPPGLETCETTVAGAPGSAQMLAQVATS